jgi:hypothetical protein
MSLACRRGETCGRAAALGSHPLKRIYQSSRGWLEVEAFETFDSHEVWLTFFDEEGWARHRVSWGQDAMAQPDFDTRRHILGRLRFEGFPVVEAERLANEMQADLRRHH